MKCSESNRTQYKPTFFGLFIVVLFSIVFVIMLTMPVRASVLKKGSCTMDQTINITTPRKGYILLVYTIISNSNPKDTVTVKYIDRSKEDIEKSEILENESEPISSYNFNIQKNERNKMYRYCYNGDKMIPAKKDISISFEPKKYPGNRFKINYKVMFYDDYLQSAKNDGGNTSYLNQNDSYYWALKDKTPSNALNIPKSLKSSNTKVLKTHYNPLDNRIYLDTKKAGKATLTAVFYSGKQLILKVRVYAPCMEYRNYLLDIGEPIKAKVLNYDGRVKWSTSNPRIAKISKKGRLKGIRPGKCKLYAKIGKKKLTAKIKVYAPCLDYRNYTLYTGDKLKAKVLNNYKGKVKWSTSNKYIAKVSKKGTIKALHGGECKLYATVHGVKMSANIKVHWTNPNFVMVINNYNTRDNCFYLVVKNFSGHKLVIYNSGAKNLDDDYKAFDRRLHLPGYRNIVVKGHQRKTIPFYVSGRTTWPLEEDANIYCYTKQYGKKWYTRVWTSDCAVKEGNSWYDSWWTSYKGKAEDFIDTWGY